MNGALDEMSSYHANLVPRVSPLHVPGIERERDVKRRDPGKEVVITPLQIKVHYQTHYANLYPYLCANFALHISNFILRL